MKLKDWLKKTNKKMKYNDFKWIQYKLGVYHAGPYKGKPIYNNISEEQIKRYPLLLECDVIKDKEYESEYTNVSLSLEVTGRGRCKQYSCELDADQVNIAFKHKGVKSL